MDVPKFLFVTCAHHVILHFFVVTKDGAPFLLIGRPILHTCVLARSHHRCRYLFTLDVCIFKLSLESTMSNEAMCSFLFVWTRDTTSCCFQLACVGFRFISFHLYYHLNLALFISLSSYYFLMCMWLNWGIIFDFKNAWANLIIIHVH